MTERLFNFSAGPAVLPESVLKQAQQDLFCLPGVGMSVLEISHRSAPFEAILNQAETRLRKLLHIPPSYQVLFLQGGASLQFSMVALNFLRGRKRAGYIDSGTWAEKAMAEARREGEVHTVWSGKADKYVRMPAADELDLPRDLAYLHMTSNETIQGIAFQQDLDAGELPLVCDARQIFSAAPWISSNMP